MTDDTMRAEAKIEGDAERWERPELVRHGLLSEITMGGGAVAGGDAFVDDGTAAPS